MSSKFPTGASSNLYTSLASQLCHAMALPGTKAKLVPEVIICDAEDLELEALHGSQGIDLIALAMYDTMAEFDKLEEPSLSDQLFLKALLSSAERVRAEADTNLVISIAPRTELVSSIPVDHHLQGGWSL